MHVDIHANLLMCLLPAKADTTVGQVGHVQTGPSQRIMKNDFIKYILFSEPENPETEILTRDFFSNSYLYIIKYHL